MLLPSLEESILWLLSSRERYGLELKYGIRLASYRQVNFGSLYRMLQKLEGNQLIEGLEKSKGGGASRRYYRITKKGLEALVMLDKMRADLARLKHIKNEQRSIDRKIKRILNSSTRKHRAREKV